MQKVSLKMINGGQELKDSVDQTKAQLADTAAEMNNQLNIGEKPMKSVVSFIDDDGDVAVYTRLLPIFTAKNKKFSSAIITGNIGNVGTLSFTQLKACHDTGLYETLGHTVDVATNLTDGYTTEQIRAQLRDSQAWLKNNGFESEGFVYPQSAHTLPIRKITREYYKYAFADNGFNTLGYLDNSRIKRIAYGSFTVGNPTVNGNSEKNTLAYYKACVDYAKTNNIWLIFMVHVGAQDAAQDTILGQLLDYIAAQSVEVVFPSEGYRLMGNKMSIGETDESHLIVGKDGSLKSNLVTSSYKRKQPSGLTIASPITAFEAGVTTVIDFVNGDNGGFPDGAGTLHTHRVFGGIFEGLSYQIFLPFNRSKTYKRVWDPTNNVWKAFVWLEAETIPYKEAVLNQPTQTIAANGYVDVQIDLAGATPPTTRVWGNPAWGMNSTVIYNIMCTANDKVTIRLRNLGATEVTVNSRDWLINYKL